MSATLTSPAYSLFNASNYRASIEFSIDAAMNKYVLLLLEFAKLMEEKIAARHQKNYGFLFDKGVRGLTTVFLTLLYYTKNLDIVTHQSQRAYFFYIEFVEQINYDQNAFLNLSSKDALLFVYKRTIYDINHTIRKNVTDASAFETEFFEELRESTGLYSTLVVSLFSKQHNKQDEQCKQIVHFYERSKKYNRDCKKHLLIFVQDLLETKRESMDKDNNDRLIKLCDLFLKRAHKNKLSQSKISTTTICYKQIIEDYFDTVNDQAFIRHLF